jgi:hypothetical protein
MDNKENYSPEEVGKMCLIFSECYHSILGEERNNQRTKLLLRDYEESVPENVKENINRLLNSGIDSKNKFLEDLRSFGRDLEKQILEQ